MGRLKQLLPLGSKPIIRHCLDNLAVAGIRNTVVVLGQNGSKILDSVKELPVKVVFNKTPESEMAESVRIGLRALHESSSGILVHLSDHPLVSVETLKRLVQCHVESPDRIIIPLYKGRRGHPTLFPKPVVEEVFDGLNLRDIIDKDSSRIRFLNVDDDGVVLDIDTPEDYKRIWERSSAQNPVDDYS
jgi:molybdenum cofactor cytidylyltransferase